MQLHVKRLAAFVLIAVLLLLTACSSKGLSAMVSTMRDGITTYNGADQKICHVADGEQRELHISVIRQKGSISISVLRVDSQKYAYRGRDIPTSDFIVSLPEPGEYLIEVYAKDFQGDYDILDRTGT